MIWQFRNHWRRALLTVVTVAALHSSRLDAQEREPDEHKQLIVHEWGTWTELQDLEGTSVGGINTDDEPVPSFVHTLNNSILESTVEPWRKARFALGKAVFRMDEVTCRLETPVVYFYPPTNESKPLNLTLEVQLRGGWLSEFYPKALAHAPGISKGQLDPNMAGSLVWKNLRVGSLDEQAKALIPETQEHVWLAPRKTQGALVNIQPPASEENPGPAETEHYLFYRGVGNFNGPLRIKSDLQNDRLEVTSEFYAIGAERPLEVPAAWLVEVNSQGEVAFRPVEAFEAPHDRVAQVAQIKRSFSTEDFSFGNLFSLQQRMREALIEDGLYADEATAMLSTWRDAYFKSPGLRLFYVVPPEWTNHRMPLRLNASAEIDRVMVGRIELMADEHLVDLAQLKRTPPQKQVWWNQVNQLGQPTKEDPAGDKELADLANRFRQGENNLQELRQAGIEIPDDYQRYIRLGRFRNAMLRHEAERTGNGNLLAFLNSHGLMTQKLRLQYPLEQAAISFAR